MFVNWDSDGLLSLLSFWTSNRGLPYPQLIRTLFVRVFYILNAAYLYSERGMLFSFG
jgi:hypothetical protein